MAERIVAGQPYAGMEDLVRRTGVTTAQLEALATAGALDCFAQDGKSGTARREALWAAGAVAPAGAALEAEPLPPPGPSTSGSSTRRARGRRRSAQPAADARRCIRMAVIRRKFPRNTAIRAHQTRPTAMAAPIAGRPRTGRMAGLVTGAEPPPLPEMTPAELNRADLWATGVSPEQLPDRVPPGRPRPARSGDGGRPWPTWPTGTRVTVGGIVTHRQRPATAQGTIFLNLEDETGLINVICSRGAWARYRRVARSEPALLIRGTIEKVEGVINLVADRIEPLRLAAATAGAPIRSRDFR